MFSATALSWSIGVIAVQSFSLKFSDKGGCFYVLRFLFYHRRLVLGVVGHEFKSVGVIVKLYTSLLDALTHGR